MLQPNHPMPTEDTNKSPTSAPRLATLKGVLIATALPMSWLVLFYSLAVHLRLALGRWPKSIGDNPHDWLFNIHYESTLLVGSLMWLSLIALPLIVIVLLAFPRIRRYAIHVLIYAVAVGSTFLLMHLAPGSFVYWWFD